MIWNKILQVETQDVVNKNTSHKNHKTKEIWAVAPPMNPKNGWKYVKNHYNFSIQQMDCKLTRSMHTSIHHLKQTMWSIILDSMHSAIVKIGLQCLSYKRWHIMWWNKVKVTTITPCMKGSTSQQSLLVRCFNFNPKP